MRGLTQREVNDRIDQGLINDTDTNISKTHKQIIIEHVFTYFNFLNLFLAGLIIMTGRFENMAFLGVVFVNTALGIIQEFKVKRTIDALSIITAVTCKVMRDGQLVDVPVDQIVINDLMCLNAGQQIPVDAKVISTSFLEVDEALLTGESEAIKKEIGDELLGGSFVTTGSCYAEVMRVGAQSYAARLIQKARHANKAASQMRDSIEKVIKVISVAIIPVGLILFQAQLRAAHGDIALAIVKTVGGVIGMIPEGLVLLTSLSFVLGVGRLAGKKALVQQKEAIEALSRVDVLCLDKTGTITTGELVVEAVLPLSGYDMPQISAIMNMMLEADAHNATQECLCRYFTVSKDNACRERLPFSSSRKYQAIRTFDDHCYVLGAPEFLSEAADIRDTVQQYAKEGLRVLMLGLARDHSVDLDDITDVLPIGLIIIKDVIKDDAKNTLQFLKKQGIRIVVLSGDHPLTVSHVCHHAGVEGYQDYVDTSTVNLKDLENPDYVNRYHIFGRVTPEGKRMIIKTMQQQGHVVGMVGDGVNDVLAIRDADCGIAMANGAEAARGAAHIILTDSNFSSLIEIIKEGRNIISNIESVSSLYLTKTIYSSLLSLIFGLFALSYPFVPIQLTILGGFAIGVPSFALTLIKDDRLNKEGFLPHLKRTAVPCALTIVVMVTAVTILRQSLSLQAVQVTSYVYIVTAFCSFAVLYLVCWPLDLFRGLLVVLMPAAFLITIIVLQEQLGIYGLLSAEMMMVYPMCLGALVLIFVIMSLLNNEHT